MNGVRGVIGAIVGIAVLAAIVALMMHVSNSVENKLEADKQHCIETGGKPVERTSLVGPQKEPDTHIDCVH